MVRCPTNKWLPEHYSPFQIAGFFPLRDHLTRWRIKAPKFQIHIENQTTFARYVPKWSPVEKNPRLETDYRNITFEFQLEVALKINSAT